MPSSTTNTTIQNNNDKKRRGISLKNTKKIRRSELVKNTKNQRTLAIANSIENHFNQRFSTLKQFNDQYENEQSNIKRNIGLNKPPILAKPEELKSNTILSSDKISAVVVSPLINSSELTKESIDSNNNNNPKLLKLVVPQSIKMLTNSDGLSSALRIPTKIQLTKTLSTTSSEQISTLTLSINQTSEYPPTPPPPIIDHHSQKSDENIKNLSMNFLGIEHQIPSKRHSISVLDWSVPPTSELSPTSLSPDDSLVELDLKLNRSSSIKRRYRALSFSCPILSYSIEKVQPKTSLAYKSKSLSRISNLTNKKVRSVSPVIKYSSIERLKKRRRDQQIYGKRLKLKTKNDEDHISVVQEVLNDIIQQIELGDEKSIVSTNLMKIEDSRSTSITDQVYEQNGAESINEIHTKPKTVLRRSKKSIRDENPSVLSTDNNSVHIDLNRQTSTPLSFHSIASSSTDEQILHSPYTLSKNHIFTDIVNELIKGAKGLDKLSCTLVNFTNTIHNFIRLTIEKQNEKVEKLQHELEKKCSTQLNRANIFCTKKIQYFLNKHSLISASEYFDEITLMIKYFYLYVLFLNCRKQENEYELILNDLIHGKLTFINELFCSSILTTIIDEFILTSTLANDYLCAQPIIINQNEYSLPFVRNFDYENELLCKNDIDFDGNPFTDFKDFEDYLNGCEHVSPSISYYPPVQQSSHSLIYNPNYTSSGQYYYPPSQSSDLTPYYYQPPHHPHPYPTYSNCQQSYPYNPSSSYYNPVHSYGTVYNEQYNYYYNQQVSYTNPNDIPLANQYPSSYRRSNSNIQKKYPNPSTTETQLPSASSFDSSQIN